MTDQEIVEEVMEKQPYILYQVLKLIDQDKPDLIEDAKVYFSKLIKGLYIDQPETEIPDDAEEILDQLIAFEDETETEMSEIGRKLMRVRHEAYVEEHGLEYVLEAIDKETPDKSMSRDLDYEFVVFHHKVLGIDFPSDPNHIIDMFGSWLTIAQYL